MFGAPGVLVVTASRPLQPRTRSFAFVVVTLSAQAATPRCVLIPERSTGLVDAMPVNEAAEISPCVTDPVKVAVITVPAARPAGADAEAIAPWNLLESLTWASTVHVRPPPPTELSVLLVWFQLTNRKTRPCAAAAASVLGATGHVFVCAKSPAFAPVRPIELIVSAPVPEFVRVTLCAGLVVPISRLPKPRLVGEKVTAGPGATPVPLSATACGLPGALSLIVTEAVRVPAAVGLKVAEIVQLAPGASVLGLSGQLLSWTKSPALAPLRPMLVITSGAVPEFSKVELWAALEVPTS